MDLITETIRKVRETLSRHGMIDPGDLVIVGVSGGPDSVCLLDILHQLKDDLMMELVVAHYDHGLRQEEDEEETQFVRHLASSMGLPFETEKGSLFRRGGSGSIEEKARDAQIQWGKDRRRSSSK
jgi:tRNA(Ile)-lysidine synthase